jgi:hypothetical protein
MAITAISMAVKWQLPLFPWQSIQKLEKTAIAATFSIE